MVNFWLGSSQGSRDKDRTVAALQEAQARQARAPAPTPAAPVAVAPRVVEPGQPTRFELCLGVVLEKEGGFADNPADPGGATNLGITLRTLSAWRGAAVTAEDVRALTREEAKEIYRAHYWNVMRCDELPRGIDLIVFDFGVNAGPATAVKALQRALGCNPDGGVGPVTLEAARRAEPCGLVEALAKARLDYLAALPAFATFGAGWTRRVEEVRRQALLMASA